MTGDNSFRLKDLGRFRLDVRKNYFTMRVVKHWKRLLRTVADIPPVKTLKVSLDWALSNLN